MERRGTINNEELLWVVIYAVTKLSQLICQPYLEGRVYYCRLSERTFELTLNGDKKPAQQTSQRRKLQTKTRTKFLRWEGAWPVQGVRQGASVAGGDGVPE